MKGIRVGCVPGVGQESQADDDLSYDCNGREKEEYGECVWKFIPYLLSLYKD